MLLFKKVASLQAFLYKKRLQNQTIGFVPTMGALHEGHLSLIQRSKQSNDLTVCSIFVNPTQFNDEADLKKYPRTTTADIQLLTIAENDILFLPPDTEIYPQGLNTALHLDFAPLDSLMEGKFRPGHFEGMAQVVNRLLDIVQPDRLYMGQKDFQQFTIVKSMLRQLGSPIELVMCDIFREPDGLAMSSRNRRLSEDIRKRAPIIHQTLLAARHKVGIWQPADIQQWAMGQLAIPDFKPEYFEIVDGDSLQTVKDFNAADFVVACTAVWAGDVRLIDNLVLKKSNE